MVIRDKRWRKKNRQWRWERGGGGDIIFFIVGWFSGWCMNTSSNPRSDKSKLVSVITESTEMDLESSRLRVFRNDEIGFRGSRSMANMFISGGFEDAPKVGSRI